MTMTIGFPRTLFYFLYYPFWHSFFTQLDCQVVTSLPTTKQSLDLGVRETVNDACLPIKLYHGHVAELKDQVDVLFIPRLVSVRKFRGETFCPKFLGLPDMIINSFEGLPQIIDERIQLDKGITPVWRLCLKIGGNLGKSSFKVYQAYRRARETQVLFNACLALGLPAQEAIEAAIHGELPWGETEKTSDLNLAVIGYPYVIYDSFLNVGLFEKMTRMGVKPLTVEMVPPASLETQVRTLPKTLFWHFSNRAIGATLYYLREHRVDGIIHVTAFGCGPDAMVDKLMELEAKAHGRMPFLTLSLDEHTGEAGVLTRIEAFVDMLRLRRGQNESIISNNG